MAIRACATLVCQNVGYTYIHTILLPLAYHDAYIATMLSVAIQFSALAIAVNKQINSQILLNTAEKLLI